MTKLDRLPENVEEVPTVTPQQMKNNRKIVVKTEHGEIYGLGRNPVLYTEKVGYPDDL